MPNGSVHQIAGLAVGVGVCLLDKKSEASPVINPLSGALVGRAFGKFPDYLEPVLHPNHRQFFHSFAVLGSIIYGLKTIYDWEPDTNMKKVVRSLMLIGGASYAGHLVLDSLTKKSLPVVGKI